MTQQLSSAGSRFDTVSVEQAAAAIAAGRPVVVAGTHGDLVFAAQDATPHLVSVSVRYTDGFVCVALPDEDCDRLGLPLMYPGSPACGGEAFAVTVDARAGGTTGISAADRARTIRLLADPAATPADFTRPGHVVPIRTARESTPHRAGRGEAALALVRLAGKREAAVLSGIVSQRDAGDLAGPEELASFAAEHGLLVVSAAEVLAPGLTAQPACPHCGHAV
ncbi:MULTISPECIES: 3,4-dihydroxy-2-butanone-4-phosphate synthase [unclassified Amycolatopsis]|uniref:3,4-dihydroxy-2-butanone-4-phosphate synthase n=1 Tax=unclassified Amycolatopsis TaxID=2618356 RepID=UPI001C6A5119|nr:3,4-dihydroxy-2-butanone-4-phosphate synthase [Amycolatopsis sp. DSM 110486]QYN21367.1 3,4-dihydroxy-2-butanone-4-phosphate synthase [Amycolatopsis sp. DSM 110486]